MEVREKGEGIGGPLILSPNTPCPPTPRARRRLTCHPPWCVTAGRHAHRGAFVPLAEVKREAINTTSIIRGVSCVNELLSQKILILDVFEGACY